MVNNWLILQDAKGRRVICLGCPTQFINHEQNLEEQWEGCIHFFEKRWLCCNIAETLWIHPDYDLNADEEKKWRETIIGIKCKDGIVLISHETIEVNEEREEERRESSASDLKIFLWHDGSVYDGCIVVWCILQERCLTWHCYFVSDLGFMFCIKRLPWCFQVIIVVTLAHEDVDFSLWRKISLFFLTSSLKELHVVYLL
ncbi:Auxin transporter-like protein [Trifolium repens]|nr:Auxin transporter-like protein [Trifolium repens]